MLSMFIRTNLVFLVVATVLVRCPLQGGTPPVAEFQADTVSGPAPLEVQFTDLSMTNEAITSWTWLFGDGVSSTLQNPAHIYAEPGTYNVSLTITTATGEDTELKLNFIDVQGAEETDSCVPGVASGEAVTLLLPHDIPLIMVRIPAGCFKMGAYPGEQDSSFTERPQHDVTFAEDFWMSAYEITKEQWWAVMGTTPWLGDPFVVDDAKGPAVVISWDDAQAFTAALETLTGKAFSLPSEAEWEYSCRAGTDTRFYWGDDPYYITGDDYAWWQWTTENLNPVAAQAVGQKIANAWALYDMAGNAAEWCLDVYHRNYVGAPADGSAWTEQGDNTLRVLRGGAYAGQQPSVWRSADRDIASPSGLSSSIAIRLVSHSL